MEGKKISQIFTDIFTFLEDPTDKIKLQDTQNEIKCVVHDWVLVDTKYGLMLYIVDILTNTDSMVHLTLSRVEVV